MVVICRWNSWIRKAPVEFIDKVVVARPRMPRMTMHSSRQSHYTISYTSSMGSGLKSKRGGTLVPLSGLLSGVASRRQKPRYHVLARSEVTESDTRNIETDIRHQEIASAEEKVYIQKQGKRLAFLKAQKSCSVAIEELDKPIGTIFYASCGVCTGYCIMQCNAMQCRHLYDTSCESIQRPGCKEN